MRCLALWMACTRLAGTQGVGPRSAPAGERAATQVYVSSRRRHELDCVQSCAKTRQLPSLSHCRLACRSIAASELVLERRRREAGHAVTPQQMQLWEQQLAHVSHIFSDFGGGRGREGGDGRSDARGAYHLPLAAAVYKHLLSTAQADAGDRGAQAADMNESLGCQEFMDILQSIPAATGANTLSYYEATMHTCACFFLHEEYHTATALYWQHLNHLPSLMVPLERIRQVPLVRSGCV